MSNTFFSYWTSTVALFCLCILIFQQLIIPSFSFSHMNIVTLTTRFLESYNADKKLVLQSLICRNKCDSHFFVDKLFYCLCLCFYNKFSLPLSHSGIFQPFSSPLDLRNITEMYVFSTIQVIIYTLYYSFLLFSRTISTFSPLHMIIHNIQ